MKYFLIALIAIALGFGAAKVVTMLSVPAEPRTESQQQTSATAETPAPTEPVSESEPVTQIDNEKLIVSFVGFGGGNTYEGFFQNVQSNLVLLGGVVAGTVTVDVTSLTTAAPVATTSWKSKASFDAVKYPTAIFSFTSWKKETENTFTASGKLTVRGVTKMVTFPVTYANGAYTAAPTVKTADFGFTNKLINEIQLHITVPTK